MDVSGLSRQIMLLKISTNGVKDEVILINVGILIFLTMENACEMIWWRLRMKMHIPIAQMYFKTNSL